MTYSLDLRERAVSYVREGGSRASASRLFGVSSRTLYNWLQCGDDLSPKRCGPRHRKLDRVALAAHVRDYPQMLLRERAAHFGVSHQSLWMMLKKLGITKKNDDVS